MVKKLTAAALLAAPLFWAAPAFAQSSAPNVLIIYGNDKCPTNTSGEEIVVCQRLDEAERFRIPKDLREVEVTPNRESWAVRQQSALAEGATGTGSCSPVGANGASGCFVKQARAAKAERKEKNAAEAELPLP
jgi:hypothetical protein